MKFERLNTGHYLSDDRRYRIRKDGRDDEKPWALIDERQERTLNRYERMAHAFRAAENLDQVVR